MGQPYVDIRVMIFNGLSARKIMDALREYYIFNQNEVTTAIKEMRFILDGYKLGFLGTGDKHKSKIEKKKMYNGYISNIP